MTAQEAARSVGKWAAKHPGEHAVIVIKAAGTAVLCRDAGDRGTRAGSSHYGWYALESLTRREDWDGRRLPNWLQDAIDKYRGNCRVSNDLRNAVMAHVSPEYTEFALTPADVLDALIYRSYVAQRRLSPEVEPARWARIFDDVEAMEARYQEDLALDDDGPAPAAEARS